MINEDTPDKLAEIIRDTWPNLYRPRVKTYNKSKALEKMYDYWVVIDKSTGKVIAHCGEETDALMLVGLDKDKRTYHKQKFILDQVITVTSTTDKQLPGQQGLPASKEELPPIDLQQQVWLPERQEIPVNF